MLLCLGVVFVIRRRRARGSTSSGELQALVPAQDNAAVAAVRARASASVAAGVDMCQRRLIYEDPVMLAVGLALGLGGWDALRHACVVPRNVVHLPGSRPTLCALCSTFPRRRRGDEVQPRERLRCHTLVQRLCTAVLLEMHRGPFLIFVASVEVGPWLGPVCIGCIRFVEGLDSSAGETRLTTV